MTKNIKNPETIALHGGEYRSDPATTAVAVPIYRTTSYQFKNTEAIQLLQLWLCLYIGQLLINLRTQILRPIFLH